MPHLEITRGNAVLKAKLNGQAVTIGRQPGNAIVINDPDISRQQCVINFNNRVYQLLDLGSRNGTRINGHLTREHDLRHGDVIEFGTTSVLFVDGPEVAQRSSRRAHVMRWGAIAAAALAGALLTAWIGGIFGSPDLGPSRGFGATPLAAAADPALNAESYVPLSEATFDIVAPARIGQLVRARFIGSPTAAEDGSLHWEMPPDGRLIAVIPAGSAVVEALKAEIVLLEAELWGVLQKNPAGEGFILRVGVVHVFRAWTGSNDALRPQTQRLLGRPTVIDREFAAGRSADGSR